MMHLNMRKEETRLSTILFMHYFKLLFIYFSAELIIPLFNLVISLGAEIILAVRSLSCFQLC